MPGSPSRPTRAPHWFADRRRPPSLARRDPQARALRPRQGPCRARRCARGRGRRLGAGARRGDRRGLRRPDIGAGAQFSKALAAGTAPGTIMSGTLRYVAHFTRRAWRWIPAMAPTQRSAPSSRRCISPAGPRSRARCRPGRRRGWTRHGATGGAALNVRRTAGSLRWRSAPCSRSLSARRVRRQR